MSAAEWCGSPISNHRGPSGSNLPVELWRDILEEACLIPGKNEFGTDPRGYWDMPFSLDNSFVSSRITPTELQTSLDTRRSIALVCKSWASVGLPILYSHFRPRLSRHESILTEGHQCIANNTLLRACVRRVSIAVDLSYRKKRLAGEIMPKIVEMLSLLDRPVIISAPRTAFWMLDQRAKGSIIIADFHLGTIQRSVDSPSTHSWEKLRYLSILLDGGEANGYGAEPVMLPAVESLEVRVAHRGEEHVLPPNLCSGWHAPRLHTLSLDDDDWTRWEAFLERHASTLEVLNAQCYPESPDKFPEMVFPALRELWMEPGPRWYYPHTKVEAPGLQRLVCHRWRAGRYLMDSRHGEVSLDEQAAFLEGLLGSWGLLDSNSQARGYCISGSREVLQEMMEKESVMKGIGALRKKGGEVVLQGDDEDEEWRQVLGPIVQE